MATPLHVQERVQAAATGDAADAASTVANPTVAFQNTLRDPLPSLAPNMEESLPDDPSPRARFAARNALRRNEIGYIRATSMQREDLRSDGERALAERLLREPEVRQAIEATERAADQWGARRNLLATAVRLSPSMAPDVTQWVDSCRTALGIEGLVEPYVYPSPEFNAAAVRPERGRLFLLFTSSLLEAFDPGELRFVIGHELGHHRIPTGALLTDPTGISPSLALRLFSWQRYAEVSCDRAGLLCAGELKFAASCLFKLASGLRGGRVRIEIEEFLRQIGDLREEASRLDTADAPLRSDWFATHPFSPLRLRAAQLCAASVLMPGGATPRDQLEARVADLMSVMEPAYLQEHSDEAESLRRVLFAAGVRIASLGGKPDPDVLKELEHLLGAGAVPMTLDAKAVTADLPRRMEDVKRTVPPLRRIQVLRDLCLIVRADRKEAEQALAVLYEIADGIGVARSQVVCSISTEKPPDPEPPRS